ncbi:MAG: transposase [Candidatus Omnitrophota bacterium]
MPRLPRIYIEGSLYYITSVGNHGDEIFKDREDYRMYLDLLKKYKEQQGLKLFSFLLTPTQLNLLMEVKEGVNLSLVMHDLTSAYTKYFNKRYQRKGHLFRGRFKSVIMEKGPYLLQTVSYIHSLPVRMRLAKNPSDYIYSSHLFYLYGPAPQLKQNINGGLSGIIDLTDEIKEVLHTIQEAYPNKKNYAEFFSAVNEDEMDELAKKLHRTGILGSEEFVEKFKAQLHDKTQKKEEKKSPLVPIMVVATVVVLSAAGSGIIYMQKNLALKEKQIRELYTLLKSEQQKINTEKEKVKEVSYESAKQEVAKEEAPQVSIEAKAQAPFALEGTEWSIQLSPSSNKVDVSLYPKLDKVQFKNNKIASEALLSKGFSNSNYSVTIQKDGRIIWETIQNIGTTTASWWGELKQGNMRGILSLRENGKEPQDFLFISTGYNRER